MNEQAWKEQAALIIANHDAERHDWPIVASVEDFRFDDERDHYMAIASELYPLVQQAIAAERGEPVAVPHVVYDMKMPPYHYQKPYTGSGGSISVPSAPPTEAQIRAEAYERCAKVAEGYVGSTPPRYESGIERRATTSQQADNCLNAIKVRAATIAAAIRSLKEADNGAEGT